MLIDIWPKDAPGVVTAEPEGLMPDKGDGVDRVCHVSKPQIEVRLANKSFGGARPAILVCPGGGYSILAYNKEGTAVADWLNDLGFSVFILKYRVPDNRDGAFADIQRALSLIRFKAEKFGIDSSRIGAMGFSAGGHLCARLSSGYSNRSYESIDAIDEVSCKPNFAILVYCAYLLSENGCLNQEVAVAENTPKTFLVHAQDDNITPMSSVVYYQELTKLKIPSELHLYPEGGHGYGLGYPNTRISNWPSLCANWLLSEI